MFMSFQSTIAKKNSRTLFASGGIYNGKVKDHIGGQSFNVKVTWHGFNVTQCKIIFYV